MSLFSFFRDIVGTRKDLVETDKAKLETEKLRDERSLIQRATLDDVKKYDPKTQKLLYEIKHKEPVQERESLSASGIIFVIPIILAISVFLDKFYPYLTIVIVMAVAVFLLVKLFIRR